ncbi:MULTISPECIES: hypothetical protein [unclassified Nonomuraea]
MGELLTGLGQGQVVAARLSLSPVLGLPSEMTGDLAETASD